ncbi:Uncharacterised protein [Bordetella pertussis]|nr:Uncharacterised protein [Bordetella pertussis]
MRCARVRRRPAVAYPGAAARPRPACRIVRTQYEQTEGRRVGVRTQRHQRQRLGLGVQPAHRFEFGVGAAIRRLQAVGEGAHVVGDGFAVAAFRQAFQAPQAQRHVVEVELLGQAQGDFSRDVLRIGLGQHAAAPLRQVVADGFVAVGVADQFTQAPFEFAGAFAQRLDLALAQRNGARAVRVGNLQRGEHVGVFDEEVGVVLQEFGNSVGVQGFGRGVRSHGDADLVLAG